MAVSLEEQPPITLTVWNKNYVRQGLPTSGFNSVGAVYADNAPGEATFTLDADNALVPKLVAEGARAAVYYEPADATISGTVEEVTGEGAAEVATRTFRIRDDWSEIFEDLIGWPVPGAAITAQGTTAYYKSTGPAETVVKAIVGANATRAGINLTVPASQGRGANITVTIRMHQLVDRLYPAIDQAGIGVRVVQSGAARTLEVYEPVTRGRVLTEDSGVIESGSYQITPPTVTRVVVGCGGEADARVFRQRIDTAAEALYNLRREVFVDARDIEETDPNLDALAQERALEALTEGAGKASLQVVLTETDSFRFGTAFNVGDRVSIQLTGAPVLTDRVREVHVSWTPTDGLLVTPIVGDWSDSTDDKIAAIVAAAAKGVRNLRSSL